MQWKNGTGYWELTSADHGFLAFLHQPNSKHADWRVYAIGHPNVIYLDGSLTLEEAKSVVQVLMASQL
jgi:hypothetical protein